MSSLTVTFTGASSVLQADFFPEITLDPNGSYSCGLLDFTSYNSIPNIIAEKNNKFHFKYKVEEKKKDNTINTTVKEKTISLPTGAYEVEDILKYLRIELAIDKISLWYEINVAASKVRLQFSHQIDWVNGTVLNVLGFNITKSPTFKKNQVYWSDTIVKITDIDVIRIDCDIVSGSYINGRHCHTIHQFSHCKVSPGYKFIEVPQHIIYLPIKEKQLRSIQISIVDQNGDLIDFRGEQISCRIHIKKVDDYEIA